MLLDSSALLYNQMSIYCFHVIVQLPQSTFTFLLTKLSAKDYSLITLDILVFVGLPFAPFIRLKNKMGVS